MQLSLDGLKLASEQFFVPRVGIVGFGDKKPEAVFVTHDQLRTLGTNDISSASIHAAIELLRIPSPLFSKLDIPINSGIDYNPITAVGRAGDKL